MILNNSVVEDDSLFFYISLSVNVLSVGHVRRINPRSFSPCNLIEWQGEGILPEVYPLIIVLGLRGSCVQLYVP